MSDFFEAVEALRTAQLQKLDHGLATLKAEHKIIHELAVDRGERLIELARTANAWKDEADALRAENIKLREDLEHAQRQPLYSTRLAADRYRWLRDQTWDASIMTVVINPKTWAKLGAYCPSGLLLDQAIGAARLGAK